MLRGLRAHVAKYQFIEVAVDDLSLKGSVPADI